MTSGVLAQLGEAGQRGLAEAGVVGALILVIIGVMTLLLKFVLEQVKSDRASWVQQSDRFLDALDGVTRQQMEMATLLRELKGELTSLRQEWREYREVRK
jgi:hypothetical protein